MQWNFEKFLIAGDRTAVSRFRPAVAPDDERVRAAVKAVMSGA